ncbi:MAG: helix-turn-helix domain-containing protein [Roseburia sp.]|nr:helix-turn-helix domain-containing protein [Roseburia sp.]
MSKEEFHNVLTGAVTGCHEDVEQILELYMPLIDKHSYVNGRLDEDLKQYLMIHIALQIGKFPI